MANFRLLETEFMNKNNLIKLAIKTGIIVVIFLFSFPELFPSYSIGLDSSYTWGLNYLFNTDYNTLKHLVYPIGPLGFLKLPTTEGNNLLYSLIFFSVMKLWFIISLLTIAKPKTLIQHLISLPIIAVIAYFSNYDILILGVCVLLGIKFLSSRNLLYILFLSLVAYLGFCIKSSIGISSFSVLFMVFLLDSLNRRNILDSTKLASTSLLTMLSLGYLVYGDFSLVFSNFFNAFKLSSGYSSALALHPENNWWLLSGFILSLVSIPFLFKEKKTRITFYLFLPSLFFMWKHAMVREDASHSSILIYFSVLLWGILWIHTERKKIQLFALTLLSMGLFYGNLMTIQGFNGIEIRLHGFSNFNEAVLDYSDFKLKHQQLSKKNIKNSELEITPLKLIGNATIDIYPWEHTFIAANDLNWSPRKTIEIGASSSQWASNLAAEHYQGTSSPEFVLFHFYKDKYEGNLGSMDYRYLLNNDPALIRNLLLHYTPQIKNENYILFKKNEKQNPLIESIEKLKSAAFDEWISIPSLPHSLIQCKIDVDYSISAKLKKFFYKDEAYFVDYLFENGKILSYRFIPSNAKEGIWCSPFVSNPQSYFEELDPIQIRIRKASPSNSKQSLHYQFLFQTIEDSSINSTELINQVNGLFLKTKPYEDSILIERTNDFGGKDNFATIDKGGYSYTYSISLDSLWKHAESSIYELDIETSTRYLSASNKSDFIIEVTGSENDFWYPVELNQTDGQWKYHLSVKRINREEHKSGTLKVYLWNNGEGSISMDDFKLSIVSVFNH